VIVLPDETKELITTLTAERGKKYDENGEAIASYVPENRRRYGSIVFLPRGCEPDKQYRVRLLKIEGKEDKAGREMYRAVPAPSTYSERWVDNDDGTFSLVTYALNWKLEESEEGVREMRPKAARSRIVSTKTSPQLHIGVDQASSFVEDTPVEVWWDEEEAVANGQVSWRCSAEREVPQSGVRYEVTRLGVEEGCEWHASRLQSVWRASVGIGVKAMFRRTPESAEEGLTIPAARWSELPRWCRKRIEDAYPPCGCRRARVDTPADKTVCARCEVEAEQVKIVEQNLSVEKRRELAAQARNFLAGQAFEQADGICLFEMLMATEGMREAMGGGYTGYLWYYRTDDAIWGSKFSPAALELVTRLPEAQGGGLVRLAAWCSGCQHYSALAGDYYYCTQVQGNVAEPALDPDKLAKAFLGHKLLDLVAVRSVLRDAEAQRRKVAEKAARKAAKKVAQASVDEPRAIGTLADQVEALNRRFRGC